MAGTDTTSISMTYFLWELTRRPDIVNKLRAELDEAMPEPKVLPEIAALNELPYLNAFMKEGLLALFAPLVRAYPCMDRSSIILCCTKSSRTRCSVLDVKKRRR